MFGIKDWYNLPDQIKSIRRILKFKFRTKKWKCSKCSETFRMFKNHLYDVSIYKTWIFIIFVCWICVYLVQYVQDNYDYNSKCKICAISSLSCKTHTFVIFVFREKGRAFRAICSGTQTYLFDKHLKRWWPCISCYMFRDPTV